MSKKFIKKELYSYVARSSNGTLDTWFNRPNKKKDVVTDENLKKFMKTALSLEDKHQNLRDIRKKSQRFRCLSSTPKQFVAVYKTLLISHLSFPKFKAAIVRAVT